MIGTNSTYSVAILSQISSGGSCQIFCIVLSSDEESSIGKLSITYYKGDRLVHI